MGYEMFSCITGMQGFIHKAKFYKARLRLFSNNPNYLAKFGQTSYRREARCFHPPIYDMKNEDTPHKCAESHTAGLQRKSTESIKS